MDIQERTNQKIANKHSMKIILLIFMIVNVMPISNVFSWPKAIPYRYIIDSHPRIFINEYNFGYLHNKISWLLSDVYKYIKGNKHKGAPGRLSNLKYYIYKYGYLYQMTGNKDWADCVIQAMEKFPNSIEAYGGANNGYAHALEGLSIGFDWCYDRIVELNKKEYFLSLIDEYYDGNRKNLVELRLDYHNYSSQAEFAMLAAGLATYGDTPKAIDYIREAKRIMEDGEKRDGVLYNVKDAIKAVDGTCNWEGLTYSRQSLFSYIKYCEAWRTATNGKINLWEGDFAQLENAGYYIIYSLRPDNKFESISDVSYPGVSFFDINNLAALQSRFKNGYFTTFINKYYRLMSGKFETDIWLGHGNTSLVFYLLWYDPDVEEKNLEELPKSRKFGDVIIMRTDFGKDDIFISFKSGIHWGFHSQLDHGSFTIYKNSPLAIDSGYYDSWGRGKKHNWNYWKRTIAHNSLLIYHPREKWPAFPWRNKCKNDGGQRMVFRKFFPPHTKTGWSNSPLSIHDLNKRIEEYRMGEITAYEFTDNYNYIKTDITKAYNNKYSGLGDNQPRKVRLVERELVYLRPDFVVIFDKVGALSSKLVKSWLLHSGSYYDKSGRPRLNGKIKVVKGTEYAGIVESQDADVVTITQGGGKLFVKTLSPEQHITRRIGGQGYEFWVNGENMEISVNEIPRERLAEDPGAWRIEIEPKKAQKYDEFLHVLYPCDSSVATMPETIRIDSKSIVGTHIKDKKKNWVAVFNRSKETALERVSYSIEPTADCQHVIFGMKPAVYYNISQKVSGGIWKIVIVEGEKDQRILSSEQGVISFATNISKNTVH